MISLAYTFGRKVQSAPIETTPVVESTPVPQDQLEWRGEGESNPIADNNTAEGRVKNRRVEVTIPSFKFQY